MGDCFSRQIDIDEDWKVNTRSMDLPKASAVVPASPGFVSALPSPVKSHMESPKCPPVESPMKNPVTAPPKEIQPMKSLRLYGDPMCPLTMQILIALRYKEIPYECSWLKSKGFSADKEEWSARNGSEVTKAVLQHGARRISGSPDTILKYVDSTFPERPLVPEEAEKKVGEWTVFLRDTLSPLVSQLLYDGEPSIQQELTPELDVALSRLNAGLSRFYGDGPYFFGEQFTLVDVLLLPILAFMGPLKEFRSIEICPAYESLNTYKHNMCNLPVYASAKVTLQSLNDYVANKLEQRAPPPLLVLMLMQHRSILWHFNKLVSLMEELVCALRSRAAHTPSKSNAQLKKLWKGYGRLVEILQEHAQMEERVIFPAIEQYNTGVTDVANSDHARDLPVTNGIREDLKSLVSMEQGTADYTEALLVLATRLRALKVHTEEHFEEEEKEFLPLLDSSAFGKEQVEPMVMHCLGVMESSHGHLFPFFLSGLNPQDLYQYMMVLNKGLSSSRPALFTRMIHVVQNADDEFQEVRRIVQDRFSEFAPFNNAAACA